MTEIILFLSFFSPLPLLHGTLLITVHFLKITCLLDLFIKISILATGHSFDFASRLAGLVIVSLCGTFIVFMFVARIP